MPTSGQLAALVFPTPVVPQVRANRAIDRRDTPNGATVTVAPWPYIQEGQSVWLRCLGTRADNTAHDLELRTPPTAITAEEARTGLVATLPLTYLDELGDYARLKIVFKASLDGTDQEVRATVFPEVVFDVPRCVTLVLPTESDANHASVGAPALKTEFGFVALTSADGPTTLTLPGSARLLNVPVKDGSGTSHTLVCSLDRKLWNAEGIPSPTSRFDSATPPIGRSADYPTHLYAGIYAKRNAALPPGRYKGQTTVHLIGWQNPVVRDSIVLTVDFTVDDKRVFIPTLAPEAAPPVALAGPLLPPTIGYDEQTGTVTARVPANAAFLPGDTLYVSWSMVPGGRFIMESNVPLTPEGYLMTIPETNWVSAMRVVGEQAEATVEYEVERQGVRTASAPLRVKLVSTGKSGTRVPKVA
jgi:hypothetical protein